MKKYITLLIFALLTLSSTLMAQPLPPSTPIGNPVPFSSFGLIVLSGLGVLLVRKRKASK